MKAMTTADWLARGEGAFWKTLPRRERTQEEQEALRELVEAVREEQEALKDWLTNG